MCGDLWGRLQWMQRGFRQFRFIFLLVLWRMQRRLRRRLQWMRRQLLFLQRLQRRLYLMRRLPGMYQLLFLQRMFFMQRLQRLLRYMFRLRR